MRGEVFPLVFNNKRKAFANGREAFSFEVGLAVPSNGEVLPASLAIPIQGKAATGVLYDENRMRD